MAKKKTSQQPAPVKDKPQAPAQDQARTAAPASSVRGWSASGERREWVW